VLGIVEAITTVALWRAWRAQLRAREVVDGTVVAPALALEGQV
jgi:hypothetical protein